MEGFKDQRISNFNVCMNLPGVLLKYRFWFSRSEVGRQVLHYQ